MERRTSSRFPVEFTLDISGQHTVGVGSVSNLSTEGCTVRSDLIIHTGWSLGLRLHLPEQDLPIVVDESVVRWSWGPKFGLEFIRMRPEEQVRLRGFVSTLETQPGH